MCNYTKVIFSVAFREGTPWPQNTTFVLHLYGGNPRLYEIKYPGPKLLHVSCTITGETADKLAQGLLAATDIEMDVRTRFTSMLGEGQCTVTKSSVTSWFDDPYSRGSFSYCCEETAEEELQQLAAPDVLQNRFLVLAGEHTNLEFEGSVHGAIIAGQFAADQYINYVI